QRVELPRDRRRDRHAGRNRDVAPGALAITVARGMDRGGKGGVFPMKCEEAEVLLHALLDDELDAGHARAIETHVASCKRCAAQLRDYRDMRGAFAAVDL